MLYIVFGLPGTGKTYFSKQLAQERGAIYLSTDVIRSELNLTDDYSEEAKAKVYDRLEEKMSVQFMIGHTVVLDGTFHKQSNRARFRERAQSMGKDVYFIEMTTGEDCIRKRLEKKRPYSQANFDVYLQLKKAFEPMKEPHLILKSDDLDNEDMLNKVNTLLHE